jgi:hypothetical protein
MATVRDIINAAMRKAKIIPLGDDPTAEEGAFGLDCYNDMMFAWEIEGLNLAHITQTLNDTVDLPDSHLEAVKLSLAERLADTYGASLGPQDTRRAEEGRNALRAYHFSMADLGSDNPLSRRNLAIDD